MICLLYKHGLPLPTINELLRISSELTVVYNGRETLVVAVLLVQAQTALSSRREPRRQSPITHQHSVHRGRGRTHVRHATSGLHSAAV